eukprot:EC094937.1.p1 GENE.EC094937.1~~EC094937.1.p1  ORF type:complete len:109 (-),score=15.09 EC094937.1:57-383(-)
MLLSKKFKIYHVQIFSIRSAPDYGVEVKSTKAAHKAAVSTNRGSNSTDTISTLSSCTSQSLCDSNHKNSGTGGSKDNSITTFINLSSLFNSSYCSLRSFDQTPGYNGT